MKNVLTKTQISKEIDEFLRLKDEWLDDGKFQYQFSVNIWTDDPTWDGIFNPTSDLFTERIMTLSMNHSIAEINFNVMGNWIQLIMIKTDDYSTNIDGDLVARICDMYCKL